MINRRGILLSILLIIFILPLSGCNLNLSGILGEKEDINTNEVFKARIHFTDGESIEAYIRELGVQQDGKVYVGGSSLNYLYDKEGNIIGAYNYQRVLYIKILPEKDGEDEKIY